MRGQSRMVRTPESWNLDRGHLAGMKWAVKGPTHLRRPTRESPAYSTMKNRKTWTFNKNPLGIKEI